MAPYAALGAFGALWRLTLAPYVSWRLMAPYAGALFHHKAPATDHRETCAKIFWLLPGLSGAIRLQEPYVHKAPAKSWRLMALDIRLLAPYSTIRLQPTAGAVHAIGLAPGL